MPHFHFFEQHSTFSGSILAAFRSFLLTFFTFAFFELSRQKPSGGVCGCSALQARTVALGVIIMNAFSPCGSRLRELGNEWGNCECRFHFARTDWGLRWVGRTNRCYPYGLTIVSKSGPPTKTTMCTVSRGRLRKRNQTKRNLPPDRKQLGRQVEGPHNRQSLSTW